MAFKLHIWVRGSVTAGSRLAKLDPPVVARQEF